MYAIVKSARLRIILDPVKNATFRDRSVQTRRGLNVHEHMSFDILKKKGIPVPKFGLVTNPDHAIKVAKSLGTEELIMKAQVLTGGRGKGKFVKSGKPGVIPFMIPQEAEELASLMIGDKLITAQTGPAGKVCNSVMIAEMIKPKHEYYLSIMMERSFNGPVIISSQRGGVDIEKVAEEAPEAINKTPIDIVKGLNKTTAEGIAAQLGLIRYQEEAGDIIMKMYDIFINYDANLVEVNPLINDERDNFYCLDAKISFDDSAEFRQKDIFLLRDHSQEDMKEVTAAKYNLNYIALNGNIGCMVNGAGLAMATMDIIKLSGGDPANFLDVGGSATEKTVKEAFKIISSDPNTKAILVNIFGGIMRCDIIAKGIIAAVSELELKVPTIVRLQGNKHTEAKNLLNQSRLKIHANNDLAEAARLAVDLSNQK